MIAAVGRTAARFASSARRSAAATRASPTAAPSFAPSRRSRASRFARSAAISARVQPRAASAASLRRSSLPASWCSHLFLAAVVLVVALRASWASSTRATAAATRSGVTRYRFTPVAFVTDAPGSNPMRTR